MPETTALVLARGDPQRHFWEQVRQARLQELAALNRLLGYPPLPSRRRGQGEARAWYPEDDERRETVSMGVDND